MNTYIARRLLLIFPTILVVTLVVFIILRLLPGDVALVILSGGGDVSVDPVEYANLREELGLNRSLPLQYTSWLWGLARLDGGNSLYSGQPVFKEISRGLPISLELAVLSTFIALLIAIPAGIFSAVYQDTFRDYVARLIAIFGLSMPVFWTGSILILILVIFFQWIPPLEFVSFWDHPVANLMQMIWPALILGYSQAALLSRMTRSSMLEVLREDYIRTAWSKGLPARHVYVRHALRNALLPIVTLAGLQFGQLVSGAVILEGIFALPGLGFQLVEGILNRDLVLVQTIVTLVGLAVMFVNLLTDLLYGWLDPKIRYGS